jgi:DNA-binding XRE family transcriptional regulator
MVATRADARRGSSATPTRRLDNDLFDKLATDRGANTEVEKAALVGIDRGTLYRFRVRMFTPSLDVAMRMAETLGTTVEKLFGGAA